MNEKLLLAAVACLGMPLGATSGETKQCSRLVTAEMRANALANVKKFDWAAREQAGAVAAAEPWVKLSDEDLWQMVTSQGLPRDIHTNKEAGCPKCANGIVKFGNYPWKAAGNWKLQCPSCGEVYPKNDFWAFYKSGLDERGFFHRERGDKSLLFNVEHPAANDPLRKVYVDDGYGLVDGKGARHRFVAYYNSWIQWRNIQSALAVLARAYTLTADPKYAHKAAVLLDRIADVYPEMDFRPLHKLGFEHSHGGSGEGRVLGRIWESALAQGMARAYDEIWDGIQGDEALVAFCAEKSKKHNLGDKGSLQAICRHIEDHLVLEILKSVKDSRIAPNLGGRKTCVVTAATALDRGKTTEQWIDWVFDPSFPDGYSLPWLLVEGIDRDGMGGECGGYGLGWTRRMVNFPGLLAKCPSYTKHNLVAEFAKLKQCFLIEPRLMCLDAAFPNIGDSGSTGSWGRIGSAATFALGYKLYKDPRMANLAWRYANANPAALRMPEDVFEKDPEALAKEIASVAKLEEFKLKCEHLGRYGQAILQTERPTEGRAVWIHYGYAKGHSHADILNIGLHAKNIDMLPDLGYPEYTGAWPQRIAWTSNTISHETLVINDARSRSGCGGKIRLFAVRPPLRVMEVTSNRVYPDIKTYGRTVALVDVSDTDSYVLDVFRARGGKNHRLSYHGPAAAAAVSGLTLAKQATGTFAGANVEFAALPGQGETISSTSGFSYLYDVERTAGPVETPYTVDWRAEDLRGRIMKGKEPHLRLHALTPCDEVALASGDPPQNKQGNPRRLRYLIQSRLGENKESQFVTVLEPYDTTPFVKQVRRLTAEHSADPNSVVAVAVELADGSVDVLISCEVGTEVKVEGGIEFNGQFGLIRLVNGEVKLMRMSNATRLKRGVVEIISKLPAYVGTVAAIDASDPLNNQVFLDPPLPQDAALVGQTVHFENDIPIDTTYDIKAVTPQGVSTGDITVIWGFKDRQDFAAGYKHLVNPGNRYVVPLSVGLDR